MASASENAGEASALADAENFLRAELADGERTVKSLKALAIAAGIAWRTIERAKKRLGVHAEKSKTAHGGWMWALSSNASASVEGRQVRQHRHSPGAEEDGGIRKNSEPRQRPPSEILGGLGGLGKHVNATIAADNP